MKPEIITLCKYASEKEGSLTIVDTFDSITALKFPWREYFYVAAKIDISDCTKDYKDLSLVFIPAKDDANPIFKASGRSPFLKGDNAEKFNIIAGFNGLIFDSAGEYILQIRLDNDIIINHPFQVVEKKR